MIARDIVVNLPEGLHMKAASDFVQLANKFKSEISVELSGHSVNAKSLLALLSLGAFNGAKISICTGGDDEEEAMQALVNMTMSQE